MPFLTFFFRERKHPRHFTKIYVNSSELVHFVRYYSFESKAPRNVQKFQQYIYLYATSLQD